MTSSPDAYRDFDQGLREWRIRIKLKVLRLWNSLEICTALYQHRERGIKAAR